MLMAHCDTNYVPEEAVLAVQPVEETRTWKPIPHKDVITSLQSAIANAGMTVKDRVYSLNASGSKMFGLWTLDDFDSEMAYTVGIRNSMDKSMALGIVAGTKVFVCDNLCFSGEFIKFRRHTSGIIEDLDGLCVEAVQMITSQLKTFAMWHKKLRLYVLMRRDAEVLTFKAMELGVINPSEFSAFYRLYFEEGAKYGGVNVYSWHEAVTDLNRNKTMFQSFDRSKGLNRICNGYINHYIGLV